MGKKVKILIFLPSLYQVVNIRRLVLLLLQDGRCLFRKVHRYRMRSPCKRTTRTEMAPRDEVISRMGEDGGRPVPDSQQLQLGQIELLTIGMGSGLLVSGRLQLLIEESLGLIV